MTSLETITSKLFEHETATLFERVRISPNDRLHISLVTRKDGNFDFKCRAYGVKPPRWPWWPAFFPPEEEWETVFPSYEAANLFFLKIPERKELSNAYGVWECAATDITALLIQHHWSAFQLRFDDDARAVYDFLLTRFLGQALSARERAEFFEKGTVSNFEFLDREDLPLAPYQRLALKSSMHTEAFALFMEQGTGKTPPVIARICTEAQQKHLEGKGLYRAIVVAPKNVRTNWINEIKRFATCNGRAVVLRGGQVARVKQIIHAMSPWDPETGEDEPLWSIVIVSYETLTKSWDALGMIPWDLAVLDESHYIKNHRTTRYDTALQLRERAEQRMVLTGTPVTNFVIDLYSQLEFLGRGLSGFTHWKHFSEFYGKWVKRGRFNLLVENQNVPFLKERLARLSFIVRKEQVLKDLPPKVYDVYDVLMTPYQAELYKKIQTQLAIEINDELDELEADGHPREMLIQNVLTKMLRLAQVTSGFLMWDREFDEDTGKRGPQRIDRLDPNPKLDALMSLLEEKTTDEKTIVWTNWVQDIRSIKARLELEGWVHEKHFVTFYGGTGEQERVDAVQMFNGDPKCRVFIGNPGAGGTGLNLVGYDYWEAEPKLTTNCNHMIYFAQDWSMPKRTQSEDRAHRRGSRTNLRITDLVVPGSIDEEIRARVVNKRMNALELQDIRAMLRSILESVPLVAGKDD